MSHPDRTDLEAPMVSDNQFKNISDDIQLPVPTASASFEFTLGKSSNEAIMNLSRIYSFETDVNELERNMTGNSGISEDIVSAIPSDKASEIIVKCAEETDMPICQQADPDQAKMPTEF